MWDTVAAGLVKYFHHVELFVYLVVLRRGINLYGYVVLNDIL
jgi:hypothetical protein